MQNLAHYSVFCADFMQNLTIYAYRQAPFSPTKMTLICESLNAFNATKSPLSTIIFSLPKPLDSTMRSNSFSAGFALYEFRFAFNLRFAEIDCFDSANAESRND